MLNNHNYLSTYDTVVVELASSPDSLAFKHQAVLCLARAGALDFAWAEYERYGLGEINDVSGQVDKKLLEDIMALKGRLLKDMALRAARSGDTDARTVFARRSVTAYARAFATTGGYYSGINVAAMTLLGERTERTVSNKASDVLDLLPNEKASNEEDTYYIEATRAECLLLMGHKNKAGDILQDALMHDPLNYTAHATTFKQFGMIMEARGKSTEWLEPFAPPTAIHFAGHIFSDDPKDAHFMDAQKQEELRENISDIIQRNDIGFGYGALAAGTDILVAETLLEEGAELHVVLPAPIDQFIATSVTPFGSSWDARFDQCLTNASSLRICSDTDSQWPDRISAQYASQSAMGRAVMRANTLFGRAAQLLIWDGNGTGSATNTDANSWREAGHQQIIIPYPGKRTNKQSLPSDQSQTLLALIYVDLQALQSGNHDKFSRALDTVKNCARSPEPLLFKASDKGFLVGFERAGNAAQWAREILKRLTKQFPNEAIYISGHYGPLKDPQNPCGGLVRTLYNISAAIIPSELYVSEPFAAALAVFHASDFSVEYAGAHQPDNTSTEIRLFHIS